MSTSPAEWERRAAQERQHLHESAAELKAKIAEARESLDVTANARRHFGSSAVVVTAIALLAGYLFASAFTRR